jgi:hydrogenase maturation protease
LKGEVLVAGVGNIFLGDDAFGVEVVERLGQRPLPENVRVVDFGIRSYDLAYALLEPWDLVILVDAAPRGNGPGTVYAIEPEWPPEDELPGSVAFDGHTMETAHVLQMAAKLQPNPDAKEKFSRILLVGCEPASVDPYESRHVGLSAAVQRAVEVAIRMIEELITGYGKATAA